MSGRRGSEYTEGRRRNHQSSSQPTTSRRSRPHFASQSVLQQSQDLNASQDDSEDVQSSAVGVVRAALRLATSGKTFKKTDLLHGSVVKKRGQSDRAITLAREKLTSVYGVELVEVTSGKYILVTPKDAPLKDELASRCGVVPSSFSSMLGVVLTLIFIQKGQLSEEYLKKTMLPKLFPDLQPSVPHRYFGNVDKLLQEFEQQCYIIRETENRDGETIANLKWGVRAEREIDKHALVVSVMSAMFGGHNNIPETLLNDLETRDPDANDSNEMEVDEIDD